MNCLKNNIMDPCVSVEFEVFGKVQGKSTTVFIYFLNNLYLMRNL